ncbi:MAG: homoserine kinase [Spirochaetes bacterium]|nr:homoserine kinase [Spirochaetota bacterium]
MRFYIRVPATSANLGPGFDALGAALSLYNNFEIDFPGSGRISGCEERYANRDNLFIKALAAASTELGLAEPAIDLRINASIPPARGLGSSAAMNVGGAAAALVLARGASAAAGFSSEDRSFILKTSALLEGHPDNAASAVYGGFCASISVPEGKNGGFGIFTSSSPIDPTWRFHAMIPPFELSTAVARAALPDTLSRSDAVFNLGRAALVALAFEKRDLALLGAACADRIHQPYRKLLIPGWKEVSEATAAAGAKAVWLSGAGPTILAVTSDQDAPAFAQALAPVLASRPEGPWALETLTADPFGVTLYR